VAPFFMGRDLERSRGAWIGGTNGPATEFHPGLP